VAERRDVVAPVAPPDAKWLPLGGGGFALVDENLFEELNRYPWSMSKWGYIVRTTLRHKTGQVIWLHREVLGLKSKLDADHKNNQRWDCRRENLRPATRSQNRMNQQKQVGNSKYKGVCFVQRRNSWFMQIQKEGRRIAARYFKDEREAAEAYDELARKHFGEFGRYNFPRPGEQSALR
jgi:regulator of replication initiation timing